MNRSLQELMLRRIRTLFLMGAGIDVVLGAVSAWGQDWIAAGTLCCLAGLAMALYLWTNRESRTAIGAEILVWSAMGAIGVQAADDGLYSGAVVFLPLVVVLVGYACGRRAMLMVTVGALLLVSGLSQMGPGAHLMMMLLPNHFIAVLCGGVVGLTIRQQSELQQQLAEEREAVVANHQAQLVRARDEADAASRAKSAFLANMSHEIRTPLNAVVGMAQVLLDTTLDETQAEAAHTIHSSGTTVVALINDILDFSRAEAEAIELAPTEVNIRSLLGETMGLFGQATWGRGVELVAEVSPTVPTAVYVDELRLRQILTNLMSNAVKFTTDGSIHVVVNIPRRDRIELTVTDSGIGIAEEALEHLFEPFRQADSSTTRRFGGTGLGLAITAGLVQLMDGELSCTSVVGEGTTFRVEIAAPALRGSSSTIADTLSGEAVLLALHRPLGARVLRDRLRRRGAEVVEWPVEGEHNIAIIAADHPEFQAVIEATEGAQRVLFAPAGTPRPGSFTSHLQYPLRWDLSLSTIISGAARGVSPVKKRFPSLSSLGLKVLVAEDNPVNQRVIGHLLSRLGVSVQMVDDGREAVAAVQETAYDVVFMDLHMPHMDGIEATRSIRGIANLRQPRIVALTASVLDLERKACLGAGMDGFVAKPIRVDHIVEALQEAVQTTNLIPV